MLKYLILISTSIIVFVGATSYREFTNSENSFVKPITKRVFISKNGFCSKSVILNSDNTYCIERGCENHSSVNIGSWLQKKDSIYLKPLDPQTFNFIKSIKISGKKSDSLYFTITDKCGLSVPNFFIVSYPYNAGFQLNEKGEFLIEGIDRNKRELDWENALFNIYKNYISKKGEDEYILMNKKGIEYFELGQIFLLSNNRFKIMSNEIEGNSIDIELNINKEAVSYTDLKWFKLQQNLSYFLHDSILSKDTEMLIEAKN